MPQDNNFLLYNIKWIKKSP